jgi:hypothetical protein
VNPASVAGPVKLPKVEGGVELSKVMTAASAVPTVLARAAAAAMSLRKDIMIISKIITYLSLIFLALNYFSSY